MNYFAAIAMLFIVSTGHAQSGENQQIVFEGSLTDASGNAIDLSGVPLVFYISANGCYLYGETTTTAGDSQGTISHRIGSSALVAGSPNGFTQNLFFGFASGTTTFAGNNCSVTPADTRLAEVYYAAENITATIKLGTVPYAHNATMLNGKTAADFIEASNDSVMLFYSGSAGQYLTRSASGLTWANLSITGAQVSTALGYTPASATALAAAALRSANLSDLASATLARSNLGLGTLATRNSVNLATAEVTGTLAASSLPSFSGDVSTAAGSSTTTLQSLRGVALAATAPVSGQVLHYNGSAWAPISIPSNIGDLHSVLNLSDLTSATAARNNLGLGSLATKSSVTLTTDVTGVLPFANGGSKWSTHANGYYVASNTAIGSSTVLANTKLLVEGNTPSQVARFINTSPSGYGIRLDVAGTSSAQYALNINNGTASIFMVQNDGRVGIGTMSPETRLHIMPGSSSLAPLKLTSGPLTSTAVAGAIEYDGSRIYVTNESNVRQTIAMGSSNNTIDNITNINSSSDINLIPDSGNGAVRVNGRIQLESNLFSEVFSMNSSTNLYQHFTKGGGTIGFFGYGTTSYLGNGALADAMVLRGFNGVQLISGGGPTANATLTSTGNFGIGTNAPAYKLDVNGDIRVTGTPWSNSGNITWQATSDARLKDVISSYNRGLQEILNLDTIIFKYKKDNHRNLNSTTPYTGVMAQQVQKQIPEAVTTDDDGFLSLNSTPIFWAMVNAIKELYSEHLGLKDELAAKDRKIQSLEERIERLEKALDSK